MSDRDVPPRQRAGSIEQDQPVPLHRESTNSPPRSWMRVAVALTVCSASQLLDAGHSDHVELLHDSIDRGVSPATDDRWPLDDLANDDGALSSAGSEGAGDAGGDEGAVLVFADAGLG
jgi:hypothetical protein